MATSDFTCGLGPWFTIRNAAGTYFPQSTGGCATSCDSCSAVACPNICLTPEPIGVDGVDSTFNGHYVVSTTCGAGTACVTSGCAPPGSYVAELCAANESDATQLPVCTSASFGTARTCVDVPFDWPPAKSGIKLEGTIGSP